MIKKGDILNQLAIITDLIEKINADTQSCTIVFEVSKLEFDKIFDFVEKKYNRGGDKATEKFTLKIGNVDIIFSTNSV